MSYIPYCNGDGCVPDVIIQFLILAVFLYRVQYFFCYTYLIRQVSSRTIYCLYFIMLGIFNLLYTWKLQMFCIIERWTGFVTPLM